MANGDNRTHPLLNDVRTLYHTEESKSSGASVDALIASSASTFFSALASLGSSPVCPEVLPFSISCPSTYTIPPPGYQDPAAITELGKGRDRPLPDSDMPSAVPPPTAVSPQPQTCVPSFTGDLPPTLDMGLYNSACLIRHAMVEYSLILTIWTRSGGVLAYGKSVPGLIARGLQHLRRRGRRSSLVSR
ncbi:hypothetical protein BDV98DRAFT_377301 [Pterulicium gracile]|uniref:Uncharacterized protein n=1 Tax=Pterulicium gracile TaxID=1884261 RepID=A0A5C3Q3A3_9AGAR|nr:hypothetical protein BDV98DRAFT_377301 [Pterula gracilis]